MNNFIDSNLKKQYLLKLAPDFSVFDIAEKYYFDNGDAGDLFYYGTGTSISTDFHRAMFRISSSDNSTGLTVSNFSGIYEKYTTKDNDVVLICINEKEPIAFSLSSVGTDPIIIGVCF